MKLVAAFIAWIISSFACHHLAKVFLAQVTGSLPQLNPACPAAILTGVHMLFCWLMTARWEDGKLPADSSSAHRLANQSSEANFHFRVSMAMHVLSTFLTNWSLATMDAASTLAIKLMEPLVSALAQWAWLGQCLRCSGWVSLPLVIGGSLAFVSKPSQQAQSEALVTGVGLAMGSNVLLAVRNVAVKGLHSCHVHVGPRWSRLRLSAGILGATLLAAILLETEGAVPRGTHLAVTSLLLSGAFHVTYSLISTSVILRALDVVSHAMANVVKRVLVVALLYVSGSRSASFVNVAGLAVASVGLAVYVRGKSEGKAKVRNRGDVSIKGLLTPKSTTAKLVSLTLVTCLSTCLLLSLSAPVNLSVCLLQLSPVREDSSSGNHARNVLLPAPTENSPFGLHWPGPPANYTLLAQWSEFMSRDYVHQDPFDTNMLALQLSNNDDVIWEMQRLQTTVLASVLGGRRHVMLLGFAMSENKGDSAITAGEMALLRRLNVSVVFCCEIRNCSDASLQRAWNISRHYNSSSLAILMHGGGNLVGYPLADFVRRKILGLFPDFPSVLLSQSIWLHKRNEAHVNECRELYSHRENLTIFLRDRQSLGLAQKLFPGTKLMLMPDMAFGLGRVPRTMPPTHDIVWIKRRDFESSGYELPDFPANLSVYVGDWWNWKTNPGMSPMETSLLMTFNGLSFLQRGRVVITDRLHGHILSVLLGIPHVLIDNPPYFKLSSFWRTWTAGLSNVALATSGGEALVKAQELLKRWSGVIPPAMLCLKDECS
ncbi:hypothetical protein C0Q70_07249 [Pomacea canaliculata]|uniref:Polysaccharide pyruvyl transferase domain-containing protein n=1 Tax=Pomacea canaliculata TaxID=400727 RepID=A0A2T7PEJ9_POMCA|nr:uncharacterized protein LOC112563037 [Pomacea canaliculata]XP_025092515.1 uncharacterized protein LOC112563037 [Pomacea canaliculata]XP_025092516.1 uncharacterized protein LOC112563037 [Pomacea canaliculata]XP_025092517.1 uncharacterized protein LOC112563037 [Pomacea canaliculata]XP_025092518.1 uncharacterized protein LOC112563037 [Pomacea canaliculata]PVD31831.1 hypothetical protein C0Q70_07249 [Pomacea canaliculata]